VQAKKLGALGESHQYLCRIRHPELWVSLFRGDVGGPPVRRSAMWDAVGLVWSVTILAYAVIAVAFILGRWAFNRIRQVLQHQRVLLHSAQHQPQ
jgi:hypothetical protein